MQGDLVVSVKIALGNVGKGQLALAMAPHRSQASYMGSPYMGRVVGTT